VPAALDAVIAECLDRDSAKRPTARLVAEKLHVLQHATTARGRSAVRRPVFFVVVVVIAGLLGALAWISLSKSRRAVFVAESLPRIESLARDGEYIEAFDLARAVDRETGTATVPQDLWELLSIRVSVVSEPAGAAITFRPFGTPDRLTPVGVAPLTNVRAPRGVLHWRAVGRPT
jgi:hypothetical protein